MLLDILFLVAGLALILAGANMLTDGASAVAKRFGVSDLIIGLTIVAFGTSAPELVISIGSAISGNAGMAIGNVVGSNLFNILVIIGVTAMVVPMKVERSILTNDIPLVILSSLVLLAMGNSALLDGGGANMLTRVDGILLLLFLLVFLRYTFASAKTTPAGDPAAERPADMKPMPAWRSALWIALGLGGLILGGNLFVDGASGIASGLGVSDTVIGLTIVAMGTSLPELATSVTAAMKGKPGIAIGNVIGSNILNIFLVLGSTVTIQPMSIGNIGNFDLLYLVGASVMFWVFGWFFKERTITRPEGAILVGAYAVYMTILVSQAV